MTGLDSAPPGDDTGGEPAGDHFVTRRSSTAVGRVAIGSALGGLLLGVLLTATLLGDGDQGGDSAAEDPPLSDPGGGASSDDGQTSDRSQAGGQAGAWSSGPVRDEPPLAGPFVETFDGDTGIDRFRLGVFHRDTDVQSHGDLEGRWVADHDIHADDCGNPHEHSHMVTKSDRPAAFYVCRDHMMTSIGHVDSYSIAWFSPDVTFLDQRTVSWEVNSTWLGGRQWWEVSIVPVAAPDLSCIDWLPCDVDVYSPGTVVVSNRDSAVRLWVDEEEQRIDWREICKGDVEYQLDAEGCTSKALRRPWSVSDNRDGTLTIRFDEHSWTAPGSFPDGPFRVVFKDHNYTPDKDGVPVGHTWHWDSIVIE
jgi:hypothetical protein